MGFFLNGKGSYIMENKITLLDGAMGTRNKC
jgi:hypothetical protein